MSTLRDHTVTIGIPTTAAMSAVADVVAHALDVLLTLHDSYFYGGDYYLGGPPYPDVRLFPNHDLVDDEPFFPEAADCPLLLELPLQHRTASEVTTQLSQALGVPCRVLT